MVALALSGEVATEVDGMRRGLGAAALDRVVPHITVVAPVNVLAEDLDEAASVARAAAARSGPLRVTLGPPATFFPRAPVVYLAVGGDVEAISALRQDSSAGPLAPPRRRPPRDFGPHVTLDQKIDPARIPGALDALGSYRASTVLEDVSLLCFDESARRWSPTEVISLGRPFVAGRGGIEVEITLALRADTATETWEAEEWARYSRRRYGDGFRADRPYHLAARAGGELAGVAGGDVRGLVCHLARLIVAPSWRSMGVGGHLLRAVERLASERGCSRVRLEALAGGAAEGFYLRHGYEVAALLPAWREELDFVMMERLLPNALRS